MKPTPWKPFQAGEISQWMLIKEQHKRDEVHSSVSKILSVSAGDR